MKAVLDTNVLIDGDLQMAGFEVAVASLSWAELRFGVTCAPNPTERAARALRLDTLRGILGPGLAFDDTAAEIYGTLTELVAGLGRDPRRRAIDLMIAATAAANGAAVITRNVDDFRGVDAVVPIVDADSR
ncbi:MAG: PIN domain-containing protein [Humibacter sp.]